MEAPQPSTSSSIPNTVASDAPQPIDKLFMENNLLRVMGHLFCHDPRAATSNVAPITDLDKISRRSVTIEPHPNYGQPGPADFKIFLAILKKLSDYGRPLPNKVYFSQLELAHLTDRAWGGRTGKQFIHSLYTLAHTRITMPFYMPGNEEPAIVNFSVPSEFSIQPAGQRIQACEVVIPEFIQKSLDDRFFSCLNYGRIRGAPTIQAALYIRLFHHFSNLQENGPRKSVQVCKRYDDICKHWLGGIAVRTHKSHILRDQLGPHLDALVQNQFLRSFSIDKTASRDSFNITFVPGTGFYDDYNRFYKGRFQNELQFKFHEEDLTIGRPFELVRRFHERRTGEKVTVSHITQAEQRYALTLLKELTYEEAREFVDYGIERANATGYLVSTISGLKVFMADFLKTRKAILREKKEVAERSKRSNERKELDEYTEYRRLKLDELFSTAPVDVQDRIMEAARQSAKGKGTFSKLASSPLFIRLERDRIIAEEFEVLTLDEWRTQLAS